MIPFLDKFPYTSTRSQKQSWHLQPAAVQQHWINLRHNEELRLDCQAYPILCKSYLHTTTFKYYTTFRKNGVYDSVDYYASANMWQLQGQKVHFGTYLTPPWPWPLTFWPQKFDTLNRSSLPPKSVRGESLVKFRQ